MFFFSFHILRITPRTDKIGSHFKGSDHRLFRFHATDSLKYRAARFLIENMPGCYYFEGEELDKHAVYFDALGKSKKQPPQILDSLYKIIGSFNPLSLKIKEDIN